MKSWVLISLLPCAFVCSKETQILSRIDLEKFSFNTSWVGNLSCKHIISNTILSRQPSSTPPSDTQSLNGHSSIGASCSIPLLSLINSNNTIQHSPSYRFRAMRICRIPRILPLQMQAKILFLRNGLPIIQCPNPGHHYLHTKPISCPRRIRDAIWSVGPLCTRRSYLGQR